MPSYAYRAVDAAGVRHAGHTSADSPDGAARTLEERGLVVVEVREEAHASRAPRAGRRRQGVLDASRSLAALLGAGLPLVRALRSAAAAHAVMADVMTDVRHRVERGESLAAALASHPDWFDAVYVGAVRAGERGGDLAEAFARLTARLERQAELRARLLTTLIYPAMLGIFGGVAVLVLVFLVLPRFAELLGESGATLPRSTTLVLGVAAWARAWWPWLAGGALAAVAAAGALHRAGLLRRPLARALLALPLVGRLRRDTLSARFARLTSVLLESGTPLVPALELVEHAIGDPVAADAVTALRERVRGGVPLHQSLSAGAPWRPELAELAGVGEATAKLPELLARAADLLEARADRTLVRLVALAEPLLIVLFGGAVGVIALALLQAVYGLNAGVGAGGLP